MRPQDAFDSLLVRPERPVTQYVWKEYVAKRVRQRRSFDPSAAALEAAERDAAELLYRHGVGSILVSILASSGLAFISVGQAPSRLLEGWWLLITLVLVLRWIDILHFHRVRTLWTRAGRLEIRRFGAGMIATAVLWAAFPEAFLRGLNQTGRAYTPSFFAEWWGAAPPC